MQLRIAISTKKLHFAFQGPTHACFLLSLSVENPSALRLLSVSQTFFLGGRAHARPLSPKRKRKEKRIFLFSCVREVKERRGGASVPAWPKVRYVTLFICRSQEEKKLDGVFSWNFVKVTFVTFVLREWNSKEFVLKNDVKLWVEEQSGRNIDESFWIESG